jgi:hypothetical protein
LAAAVAALDAAVAASAADWAASVAAVLSAGGLQATKASAQDAIAAAAASFEMLDTVFSQLRGRPRAGA